MERLAAKEPGGVLQQLLAELELEPRLGPLPPHQRVDLVLGVGLASRGTLLSS